MAAIDGTIESFDESVMNVDESLIMISSDRRNRTPLLGGGLTRYNTEQTVVKWNERNNLTRTDTLASAVASAAVVTMTVSNPDRFFTGQIVEIGTEQVRVASKAGAVLTIARGQGGTTAAAHASAATCTIIGVAQLENSAVAGVIEGAAAFTNPCQLFTHPYALTGSKQAHGQRDGSDPLLTKAGQAMEELGLSIEKTLLYGNKQTRTSTVAGMMGGFRSQITGDNRISRGASYKPSQFNTDLQVAWSAGGDVDLLVVSGDVKNGFALWGWDMQQITPGETQIGIAPMTYQSPLFANQRILVHPLLDSGTIIGLTTEMTGLAGYRWEQDQRFAMTQDGNSGQALAELSLIMAQQTWHVWIEDITSFAQE